MGKNYYEILEISKDSTPDDIKKAYKKLCKIHHPDKGGNEERFKEIAEAYEVLSNPEKKSNYDTFGNSKGQSSRRGNQYYSQPHYNNPQKVGETMILSIKLTLEEIFTGVKKKYKYTRNGSCDTCHGHGGTESEICGVCKGNGVILRETNTAYGTIRQIMQCYSCDGSGNTFKNKCDSCKGSGTIPIEETIEVDIPSGVQEGMTFIMAGKGHSIKGGVSGDLHINIMELPHKVYVRNVNDLKMNLKLTYSQLVLGDKVEIDTIEGGKIRVTIPEYSDVGGNLRIPNKGLKMFNNDGRGDIVITLNITIPKNISEEDKEILKKLK